MDSNFKRFSQQQISLLDSCMIQSRTSLFYQEEDNNKHTNLEETDIVLETRKFKIQIEEKFHECQPNQKYVFPRDMLFEQQEFDQEEQQMLRSLSTARFYRLAQQNNRREEVFQKLKKSRSDIGMGLFKQALQIEKTQSRNISKSKVKDIPSAVSTIKHLYKFKKAVKDKQNNLNFQNLREDKQICHRISISKSKNKNINNEISASKSKQSKINIPKINLSDRQQPKCFKDLARLDNNRR